MNNLLEVKDFSVSFRTYAGEVQAVRRVSFSVKAGERIAIVGESGSGKSVMTQSLVQLLPSPPAFIKGGSVRYGNEEIVHCNYRQLRHIKGAEIAYIFQDPMTSLNPTLKIGQQIIEGINAHGKDHGKDPEKEAIALLREAGIPSPERRMRQYPYELSGGMRQRVMIALAIAMHPKLLIADEPTTALDVTIQSQILGTLKRLNEETGMALILITHDMGVVAGMAQRVLVMYGGCVVESGNVFTIFEDARHPYTRCLQSSVPRLNEDGHKPLAHIIGSPPDMLNPPAGCPFAPRCHHSMNVCFQEMPEMTDLGSGHEVCCWLCDPGAQENLRAFEAAWRDR